MLLDKPAGVTSHDVVAAARRALDMRRIGHTGTLDPFATGLLVLLAGRVTRLARYLTQFDKVYEGVIRFGATSDTDDPTGTITTVNDSWQQLSDDAISLAMDRLTGSTLQRPPMYSAKKVSGERAHRLARRGNPVELEPCRVRVDRFRPTARRGQELEFEALVGAGTYVRALARDLGSDLGCGAYVQELRRTAVGPFRVEQACTIEELRNGLSQLLAPAVAVEHLPVLEIDEATRQKVVHGQPVEGGEVHEGAVALIAGVHLVAVAEPQGRVLKPRVVLEG